MSGIGWMCITGKVWASVGLTDASQQDFAEIQRAFLLPEGYTIDAVDCRSNDDVRVYRVCLKGALVPESEGFLTLKPVYRKEGQTVSFDHMDVFHEDLYKHFPTDETDNPDFYTGAQA